MSNEENKIKRKLIRPNLFCAKLFFALEINYNNKPINSKRPNCILSNNKLVENSSQILFNYLFKILLFKWEKFFANIFYDVNYFTTLRNC